MGLKMLSIIAVRHPSAAAVLQTGVQITGSVWVKTSSHTMTSRSQRLIWPAKSACRAAPNSLKPQKAPQGSAQLPASPACPRLGGGTAKIPEIAEEQNTAIALIVLWSEMDGVLKCEIANNFYILYPKYEYVEVSDFPFFFWRDSRFQSTTFLVPQLPLPSG